MPIFLDRHDVGEFSAADIANLHLKDLEIQERYGVKFLTYWYDAERRTTFCLVDAPDRETANKVHEEAHGKVAHQIIPVDLSTVEAFLGRIEDPPTAKTKPIDDSAFRSIMFTDIVGSTQMTAELGDTMAMELIKAHDGIIRRCLKRHGGSEVKHLGDGIMASFESVPESVACAIQIQQEFETYNAASEMPLHIRIGIHAGEPVHESNDLFGSAVQLTARICDAAAAGAILVSAEVKNACDGGDLNFESAGLKNLKGFTDPIQVFVPTG